MRLTSTKMKAATRAAFLLFKNRQGTEVYQKFELRSLLLAGTTPGQGTSPTFGFLQNNKYVFATEISCERFLRKRCARKSGEGIDMKFHSHGLVCSGSLGSTSHNISFATYT